MRGVDQMFMIGKVLDGKVKIMTLDTSTVATGCFLMALLHTFSVKQFQHIALKYPADSVGENFFHLLGEVEVVFGLWAGIFMAFMAFHDGAPVTIKYVEGLSFTEPAFVFVVMSVCSARPILRSVSRFIEALARVLPVPRALALYFVTLTVGPLLGSFISEPAAMTVTALILLDHFYSRGISTGLKYATLGLLFVNVSIGGTLTHFAAPPVLMVANIWNWDSAFMLREFGWKGALACVLSTLLVAGLFARELAALPRRETSHGQAIPLWVAALHFVFLGLIVASSHYTFVFMWIFLFFLGLVSVTREYQDELRIKEGLLVAFFLAGLVVLGPHQHWWLRPALEGLDSVTLYLGSLALTAITDNATLTYLGTMVDLDLGERYALVAGAVVGGGLTVIANSPNPAGFGILNASFGDEGISPLRLFYSALAPTVIAACCFWFF